MAGVVTRPAAMIAGEFSILPGRRLRAHGEFEIELAGRS